MPTLPPLWGCTHNEERSPYSTGLQTCTGELHYERPEDGSPFYICTKHRNEHDGSS